MNHSKYFLTVLISLLMIVKTSQLCAQTDPPVTEETVALELGVVDSEEYGRNYGRNANVSQLDVSFTPIDDLSHLLSWQVFDIERDEMLIFLNDTQIRSASTTASNSLGSVDGITILPANLISGVNTLSFRVSGGDEVWGVTSLSVESIPANVDGEPATTVLLDAPDQGGPVFGGVRETEFTFSFSPRGQYYDETISISFDSYVASGGFNGFDLSLNGQRVKRVNSYRGASTFITQTISLDKSQVLDGENIISIKSFTGSGGSFGDAGFANVEVLSITVPLLDVSVTEVSIDDEDSDSAMVEVQANVANIGAKVSPLNTLTFLVSRNEDKSNSTVIASSSLLPIPGGITDLIVQPVDANKLRRSRYLWACLDRVAEDLVAANDCSPVVMHTLNRTVMSPIMMLLSDD